MRILIFLMTWIASPCLAGANGVKNLFLNGVDISSARSQELKNVDVIINEQGDIFLVAPHYQVNEEDTYIPLSKFAKGLGPLVHKPMQMMGKPSSNSSEERISEQKSTSDTSKESSTKDESTSRNEDVRASSPSSREAPIEKVPSDNLKSGSNNGGEKSLPDSLDENTRSDESATRKEPSSNDEEDKDQAPKKEP